ncbi:VTT domain-containing protein [Methylotenera mobilis]|uniref:SNARE associated Golgi protein n=1 Tax=Methylotenera mobilis (strain JLW8 / ATCC BAA-1282 / DSM 17540) TaxID=583345 RepID=C6WYS9_METML|nr:VTT domain-containing protein [Methylotenera mobilis]ACT47054.1 SNARE associated Golgi protein [Methylotenera mobilis JLW8]
MMDLFLHLDKHLAVVASTWGLWIYVLLFLIIFIETGLVAMPFLPGDSLLFVAGAIAAVGGMSLPALMALLSVAAIAGDAVNYAVGKWVGHKVFAWENSRWFNKDAFNKTHAFYEEHGAITIVVGRFLPFIRTFTPFVAGVAQMTYAKFAFYNVIGGLLWVCGLTGIGFLVGNHPWVQANFSLVALALIIIPSLPAVWVFLKHLMQSRA